MSDLTDFLLARIAEDERHARKLAEVDRRPVLSLATTVNHPQRILLECESKRRIVEALDEAVNANSRDVGGLGVGSRLLGLLDAVHYLALPYADHPDHREEWKP